MATTSIWSIKNNLKQSINYIINQKKTTNDDYGKVDYDYLEGKKDYNFKKENEGVLIVGIKTEGHVKIINVFSGKEAYSLYKKLRITKLETMKIDSF